ncbi:MAG: HAD-IIB family hydrolase [Candidatus Yanofskybacteria bacterium]|nr:HAD-IIB family hydrolase [Candidatus Yanofskybacteria bacterium]
MKSKNLLVKVEEIPKDKQLIVFDLDGTLTESKSEISLETAALLTKLLKQKKVGIAGGGTFERFKVQVLAGLAKDAALENLFLFPLNGGSFYGYQSGEWRKIYSHELSDEEKENIHEALARVFKEIDHKEPDKIYGEQIEDRGDQITFSTLGQQAPLNEKTRWAKEHDADRLRMALKLREYLPDMEVKTAGLTSIDITRKGIDKKLAIEKLTDYLNIPIADTLFVGDAFDPDGNDYPVLESGVLCFKVESTQDTRDVLRRILE